MTAAHRTAARLRPSRPTRWSDRGGRRARSRTNRLLGQPDRPRKHVSPHTAPLRPTRDRRPSSNALARPPHVPDRTPRGTYRHRPPVQSTQPHRASRRARPDRRQLHTRRRCRSHVPLRQPLCAPLRQGDPAERRLAPRQPKDAASSGGRLPQGLIVPVTDAGPPPGTCTERAHTGCPKKTGNSPHPRVRDRRLERRADASRYLLERIGPRWPSVGSSSSTNTMSATSPVARSTFMAPTACSSRLVC